MLHLKVSLPGTDVALALLNDPEGLALFLEVFAHRASPGFIKETADYVGHSVEVLALLHALIREIDRTD